MSIAWSGCPNARDLGGLPAGPGRRIRSGTLIRSDSLAHLDPAGRAAVRRLQPGAIVDLRSAHELVDDPNPFADSPAFRHRPFLDPMWEAQRDDLDQPSRQAIYRRMLTGNRASIGAAIRAIDEAPPDRPIVIHCAGGKDRTGLIVAFLLELAGVPRALIVDDWVASEEALGIPAMLAAFEGTEAERRTMDLAWRTPPEALWATLEEVDREDGGVRGFLHSCGVDDATMDGLAERFVERTSSA